MEIGATIKHDIKKAPKTGEWGTEFPEVDEKCIACGTCVSFCPEAAISLEPKTQNAKRKVQNAKSSTLRVPSCATIDRNFCKGCGVCANICPVKAINMVSCS